MTSEEIYTKLEPIIKTYLPEDVSAKEISRKSDLTRELNINSAHKAKNFSRIISEKILISLLTS
jgi:hypothetical protein